MDRHHMFSLEGSDLKSMNMPPKPPVGSEVVFQDGFKTRVSPGSLRSTTHDKQISKFDLNTQQPMFEHATSARQTRFEIPQGQFGSNSTSIRSQSDHAKIISYQDKMQPFSNVGSLGPKAVQLDEDDTSLDGQQQDDPRGEAQVPGAGGLRGSYDDSGGGGRDRPISSSNLASIDHQCPRTDQEDPPDRLSLDTERMPSRIGLRKKVGESTRKIPGMHSLRKDQEGAGSGLRGADLQHQGDDLCPQPQSPRAPWRKDQASGKGPIHTGILGQLGKLLCTVLFVGLSNFGAGIPTKGQGEWIDQSLFGNSQESSFESLRDQPGRFTEFTGLGDRMETDTEDP